MVITNAPSYISLLIISLILFGSIRLRHLLKALLFRIWEDRHV